MLSEKEFRLKRAFEGWTQTRLATELAVTQEHLSRVEAGKEPVSRKLEKRYRKLFRKENRALFGKETLIEKLTYDLTIDNKSLRTVLLKGGNPPERIKELFRRWDEVRNRSISRRGKTKGGDKS